MRRFVVVGRTAHASPTLRLDDIAGSGGRLDILLRCVRAALLVSHGLRRDVAIDLLLGGTPGGAPAVRIDGARASFIRPDERNLAVLVQRAIAQRTAGGGAGFVEVKPGVSTASDGLDAIFSTLDGACVYVLERGAPDVRDSAFGEGNDNAVVFLGDHLGIDEATRERLARIGACPLGLGPIDVHAEDAIAILSNEIDRREADRSLGEPRKPQRA